MEPAAAATASARALGAEEDESSSGSEWMRSGTGKCHDDPVTNSTCHWNHKCFH